MNMINISKRYILKQILFIFNISLIEGIFLVVLNNVIKSIYKNEDNDLFAKYMPISSSIFKQFFLNYLNI